MLAAALAFVTLAAATEIRDPRALGLGVEFGNGSYLNLSGKLWTSDTTGVAAHVGTNFYYHEVGARFEKAFLNGQDWVEFAEIPVWWWVGADVGYFDVLGYSGVQVGGTGGVAAAIQLHETPIEIFTQAGLGVFPLNYCSYVGVRGSCLLQGRGTGGIRYYFQ